MRLLLVERLLRSLLALAEILHVSCAHTTIRLVFTAEEVERRLLGLVELLYTGGAELLLGVGDSLLAGHSEAFSVLVLLRGIAVLLLAREPRVFLLLDDRVLVTLADEAFTGVHVLHAESEV